MPILVDIVTPLSTILVQSGGNSHHRGGVDGDHHHRGINITTNKMKHDLSTFGRGSEKLGSGNCSNKDFLYNTLNYQERQYIYK